MDHLANLEGFESMFIRQTSPTEMLSMRSKSSPRLPLLRGSLCAAMVFLLITLNSAWPQAPFAVPIPMRPIFESLPPVAVPYQGSFFANEVCGAGDVDGDGFSDYAFNIASIHGYALPSSVSIRSGRTGQPIATLPCPFVSSVGSMGDSFGRGFAAASNRILVSDVAAPGVPGTIAGAVALFELPSGQLITTALIPLGSNFDAPVCRFRDVNVDGYCDFLVYSVAQGGTLAVLSGYDLAILQSTLTPGFGNSPCLLSEHDLDGDAIPDAVIWTPYDLRAISGANLNTPIWTTPVAWSNSGFSGGPAAHRLASHLNDIDGDGVADLVIPNIGNEARILSGATGQLIRSIVPVPTFANGVFTGGFDMQAGNCGDVDHDGLDDLAISLRLGAPNAFAGDTFAGAFSAATGALISTINFAGVPMKCTPVGDMFGDGSTAVIFGTQGDRVVVAAPTLIGSVEDLGLTSSINAAPLTDNIVKPAVAGDYVTVHLESPNGSLLFTPPILAAQLVTTGSPIPPPTGFPEIHINPDNFDPTVNPVFVMYDQFSPSIGAGVLPPGGISFAFLIFPGLEGSSAVFQGFALSASARNNIFAASNAHEIRFVQ